METARAIARRTFLRAGGLSAFGLTLPDLLNAQETQQPSATGKAKNCILLFATGGPAQQETFDPKPDAVSDVRGEFDAISTNVPGIQISEHLPMLARCANLYSIIRSTHHDSSTHGTGTHYNLTGQAPAKRSGGGGEPKVSRRDPPCIGGAIRQIRGDRNGLPAAVHLPARIGDENSFCLLYTSPSPRDQRGSRMPSSA